MRLVFIITAICVSTLLVCLNWDFWKFSLLPFNYVIPWIPEESQNIFKNIVGNFCLDVEPFGLRRYTPFAVYDTRK